MMTLQNICVKKRYWVWYGWDYLHWILNFLRAGMSHIPLSPQTLNHLWYTEGVQCIVEIKWMLYLDVLLF